MNWKTLQGDKVIAITTVNWVCVCVLYVLSVYNFAQQKNKGEALVTTVHLKCYQILQNRSESNGYNFVGVTQIASRHGCSVPVPVNWMPFYVVVFFLLCELSFEQRRQIFELKRGNKLKKKTSWIENIYESHPCLDSKVS